MIVNPKTCIRNKAPTRETGIARMGIRMDLNDPRNKKMMSMTIASVSRSVTKTSLMALLMYSVAS